MKAKGTVYLIGAGPGDVGLLTVRAAELLARADVVVYDPAVNAACLQLAGAAELIPSPPDTHDPRPLLVAKAREGKCVACLYAGDPFLLGHGGVLAEELAAARVPFEVVPGVSSILAGPNCAGIPLTHRDYSSSLSVYASPALPETPEGAKQLDDISKIPGTKVILTRAREIRPLAEALLARGMPADTPVSIIQSAATSRQQSIQGTLSNIAAVADREQFSSPAITVIGDVVRLKDKLNWFERRPLFGQRVVVTRARDQAPAFTRQLTDLGAEVLEIPTIKIVPPVQKELLAEALLSIGEYDWLVFTSPNGVTTFFDYFLKGFQDVRAIGNVRIAAVGPGTAAKIAEYHLRVDVVPKESLGRNVAAAINSFESVENLKVLLLRAEVANPDLPKALEELGAIVDDAPCYKTVPETEDRSGAGARFLREGADWLTFTSASTVENFHGRFDLPEILKQFPNTKIASIGPETSKALQSLGIQPHSEARQHTIEGLVSALQESVNGKRVPPG